MAFVTPVPVATGDLVTAGYINQNVVDNVIALLPIGIVFIFQEGVGIVPTTGIKHDLEIPFKCDINRVTLLAEIVGSFVLDIWKVAYASYPAAVANSITAAAKPTLASTIKYQDSSLTGWTTGISAGDCLRTNVDSVSVVTRVTAILKASRS